MKTVIVTVLSNDPTDNSATACIVERDRGAGYLRMDGKDVVTNKDKEVKFNLRQGERLVIEAYQAEGVKYDPTQGAAYTPSSQKSSDGGIDKPRPGEEQRTQQTAQRLQQEQDRLKSQQAGGQNPDGKVQGQANNSATGQQGSTGQGAGVDKRNDANVAKSTTGVGANVAPGANKDAGTKTVDLTKK